MTPGASYEVRPVALTQRLVVGVDLAHTRVAQALVHRIEVVADDLLRGLRDAPAVRLTGGLERGVVDPGPGPPPAARARLPAALVLGDEGVLDRGVQPTRLAQQVEGVENDGPNARHPRARGHTT